MRNILLSCVLLLCLMLLQGNATYAQVKQKPLTATKRVSTKQYAKQVAQKDKARYKQQTKHIGKNEKGKSIKSKSTARTYKQSYRRRK